MKKNYIKEQIKANFSKAVNDYDNWASVQKKTAKELIPHSSKHKKYNNILDIGCGTGNVIHAINNATWLKYKTITGIDFSANMVDFCKNKWPHYNFICKDAEKFIPHESYDLITANFVVQWFYDINEFIKNYMNVLNDNGIIKLAFPVNGSFYELKKYAQNINNIKLNLYKLPNAQKIISAFQCSTNIDIIYNIKNYSELYSNPLSCLKAIKKIGGHYKHNNPLTIGDMKNLYLSYNSESKFPLTYKVLFLTLTKK